MICVRVNSLCESVFAVFAQDRSRRLMVAAAILAVHAAVIYALLLINPALRPQTVNAPVEVRFVASPAAQKKWQPPEVKALVPSIVAPMPQAPLIESPVMQPSDRAIAARIQMAPAPPAPVADGAPRLISAVEYLREPSPRYPPQSRRLREQGLVVLRVLIDENGVASSIEVETSSGYTRLDHAARDAVARAAFRPYVEDGAPRRALVLIPIEFSLNRSSA